MYIHSHIIKYLTSLAFVLLLAVSANAGPNDYKLGVQDKLGVRVYEWRQSVGELHEWPALNGDFTVNASGSVMLPLIGEVDARGHSAVELASVVAERLQAKVGLVDKPSVVVDVLQYRPIYLVSGVQRPGEIPFRPGMTLMQAISIAGGFPQDPGGSNSSWQSVRDLLALRGELRQLDQTMLRLHAHRARVEAEQKNAGSVEFPAEVKGNASIAAGIMKEEQAIFAAHREAVRKLTASLEQQKTLSQSEIETLQSRIDVAAKQQVTTTEALKRMKRYLTKGYLTTARLLAMERGISDLTSSQLDFKTRIVVAQEEIARVDKQILDMQTQREHDLLTDLQDTNAKIEEALNKSQTVRDQLREAESTVAQLPSSQTVAAVAPDQFSIRRGDKVVTGDIGFETPVEPGDVITLGPAPAQQPGEVTAQTESDSSGNAVAGETVQ